MPINVLIVDDNRLMRKLAARAMVLSGLPLGTLAEASNGEEALQRLRERWFDLVLLDLNMPKLDGEGLLRHLRADEALRSTSVVVVTSDRTLARLARLTDLGAVCISKPATPEEIAAVVRNIARSASVGSAS